MDILGSIMKKMEGPPAIDEKERKLRQQQKETQQRHQDEKEAYVKKFRSSITERIKIFATDETQLRLVFETMDKLRRAILHDIADTAGLLAHSFGTEDVDRHVIVFKPEGMPSEPELQALRRGEEYNPQWECQTDDHPDEPGTGDDEGKNNCTMTPPPGRGRKRKQQPEYLQKYEKHLGGLEVAKDAAQSTESPNRTYGFVTSENKKDKRTIEETLADIRARKKQKAEEADNNEETL
ncbi:sperm-associated antigen 7 homolog [Folsomia candida]|uniref:Sperm-associated antigen 7 n=1 Tax=Folsomia candida TaxID=158441 RepID=A0A226E0X3_FOLCA|nr:sperm-associated antigen 7 homolog [Folsomia candida]OXA51405.1 Sperm-associated antigen 7 [Folsomia candida]